jgi:predicted DNA binding protein
MLEAVIQCPQPHKWVNLAVSQYSASIEILDSKMSSGGNMRHLFDAQVRPELVPDLIATINADRDVLDLEVIKSGSGHVYGASTSARCTVCREVAKSNCFLASVSVVPGGFAKWTVLGSGNSFRELTAKLEERKIPFEVKLQKTLEDKELLTARQEQILTIAFERGYYDFPKRLGLAELAAMTGIRESTLGEILRRGQKKIVGEYLAKRSLLHEDRR